MDHHNDVARDDLEPRDAVRQHAGSTMMFDTVICDLDGVVWLEGEPIGESAAAIAGWREMGHRVLFVTNNSTVSSTEHAARLAAIGIEAHGDVISSSDAAAAMIAAGESVMVLGGPGITDAVTERGAQLADPNAVMVDSSAGDRLDAVERVDVVVVGLDRRFDYQRLSAAAAALRSGARFIATNEDPALPTPTGPMPGAGSIVAAVAAASSRTPVVAGKPHQAIVAVIHERLGPQFDPARALVVGDRLGTDGALAARLGCRFALVRDVAAAAARHDDDDEEIASQGGDEHANDAVDAVADDVCPAVWLTASTVHEVMVACRVRACD